MDNIQEKVDFIKAILVETDKIISREINKYIQYTDSKIKKIIKYALEPKGLRERPLLMRFACEALEGYFNDIIPAAVAVEFLHFSSIVIDDFLDESELRGNKKTVVSAYGEKNAVIIGELLNCLSFLSLLDLFYNENNKNKMYDVIHIFKETQRDIYYGQYLDLSFQHQLDIDESNYFKMISKTTASLIKCSLKTGAILGGGNHNNIRGIDNYGECLGIAFQIRDDIIDIIGDPNVTGKSVGGDIRQGKMRLPLIKALSNSEKEDREFLINLVKSKKVDNSKLKKCIEILKNGGSIESSKKVAYEFSKKAISHLSSFKDTPAKDGLIAIAKIVGSYWQ